ncbi:hypothetical protein [Okeania sp. KiyG1]|nr:hypothetical protein [Okeania sp. KiyG1]
MKDWKAIASSVTSYQSQEFSQEQYQKCFHLVKLSQRLLFPD